MPTVFAPVRFGAFRVHPTQGLSSRDREIHVTPKSLAVLYELASRAPRVVTKTELLDAVWPDAAGSDAALSSCIREVRIALADDARKPRYIETVHGRGFRLKLPATIESIVADSRGTERSGNSTAVTRADPAQPAIVVLPFQSISPDPAEPVLARGLVHDIITRVARSRLMLVVARGTSFHFENRAQDVQAIGEQLGVRYVVQGSVQVSGDRVRISVALASVASGTEIWSEQYSRKLTEFLDLQEDIAALIVSSLESEVQREEVQRSLLMPSASLDAWSAYHRGLHFMYRFRSEDCDEAEALFRRSIDIEPDVPRPYAGLSFVHFEHVFLNFSTDRRASIDKAVACAQQSIAIDARDPMGYWALSRAQLLEGDLEASKASLEIAIDLNPSYAIAQYSLGWVALQLGDNALCKDKVAFARRLSPCDPLQFAMLGVYALNLALMGETAEAAELSVESTNRPNAHHLVFAFAAVTLALDGQGDRAKAFLRRVRAERPGYGVEDFLNIFRFQQAHDIERVRKAFVDMGARVH